jgi:hypothetical protein
MSSKKTLFLLKMSKKLHMSFAALTHPAEGLFLNALLTLKSRKFSFALWAHEYQQCP